VVTPEVEDTSIDRGVVRTCVGCRTRRRSADLVRCTLRAGVVTVDGPSDGRGAWLCRGSLVACARAALRTRGFQRAWRTELDDGLVEQISSRVAQRAAAATHRDEAVGPH
jgi:predicted RNA-binding protein YlxR (DUF448 family)